MARNNSSSGPKPPPAATRARDEDTDRSGSGPISVREKAGHLVPDRTVEAPPAPSRTFTMDGQEWIARIMGEGDGGTGDFSPAYLAAIRFYSADAPDTAVREVLCPRGRFESLYDDELCARFERATEIGDAS